MQSITALLIILSLLGYTEIAAEVGIIQGAILVFFMAFSANARNLILSDSSDSILKNLIIFRIILVLPLSIGAYFLSIGIIDTSVLLIFALILRRCTEWIAELQISENERLNNQSYACWFVAWQVFSFFLLIITLFIENKNFYHVALYFWSITPIIQLVPFVKKVANYTRKRSELKIKYYLPHFGSSWIIAITVFVFRVLIIVMAGKAISGLLFSAYAIGGMVNSFYTYALGPSIAMRRNDNNVRVEVKYTFLFVCALICLGLVFIFLSMYEFSDISNSDIFMRAIGFSLIGGGIMLLAQRQRIHVLQIQKNEVFCPDVLSNILIIATVPFAFHLFGHKILVVLFFWNACLSYIFFMVPLLHERLYGKT